MKRKGMSFFIFATIIYLTTIISCSPSLGASWYAKSGGSSSGASMSITSIKVAEKEVEVRDVGGNFAKAKRFAIVVPYGIKEIDASMVKIEAYESEKKEKAIDVSIEIEGDSVPLVPTESVSVVLRVVDNAGKYKTEEKFISITREEPVAVDLVLEKIEVHGVEATLTDGEEGKVGSVDVAYSKGDSISSGDIKATFKLASESKTLPVVVEGGEVPLKIGEAVSIKCSIEAKKWEYNAYSFSLNCTRLAKKEGEVEPLKLKYLSVFGIDARSGLVKVASNVQKITAGDVSAIFEGYDDGLPVSLQTEEVKFDSAGSAELEITVAAKEGEYPEWKKTIHAVQEGHDSGDPTPPQDEDTTEPEAPEPPKVDNPKDENGNEKFIIKLNVKEEMIDPFDWYKEDYGAFSATKFDEWILNMTAITNDNVPSYAFKPGSWSGSPLSCEGDAIGGNQLNRTWNLHYYKYASQEERWQASSGFAPNIDDAEKERRKRFLFFRFTGDASAGTKLDSSMFCVDTHTKFLFYYSSPANISRLGVPSNWKDYEQADDDRHKQFDKPFYMSDPIGYVEENGNCVIYGWCKQHIRGNDYTAPLDNSFKRKASRKPGGQGYSPYRDKVKKITKTRSVEPNPEYTAQKPVIQQQSGALYLTLDEAKDAILSIKVKEAPEGEALSYQWYKNATNSIEGGEVINDATDAKYTLPEAVVDAYFYCLVTNTNSQNNKSASTASQPVKVRIAKNKEELKIDAETPIIEKHPESSKHSFVDGKDVKVSLEVKVKKPSDKGVISYQWFENTISSTEGGSEIADANKATYKTTLSVAGTKYYYCKVTNTSEKATGEKVVSVFSAIAKIEIDALYELNVECEGDGTLTVFGAEGKTKEVLISKKNKLESRTIKVKIGSELLLIAKEAKGWNIKDDAWKGINGEKDNLSQDKKMVWLKIENETDAKNRSISISFTEIPKEGTLSIKSIMIDNISLNGKNYDFTYFDWDINLKLESDAGIEEVPSIWKKESIYFTRKDKGASSYVMPEENAKDFRALLQNQVGSFEIDTYLRKKDSTPLGGSYFYRFEIDKHKKNIIKFEYDAENDCWRVKDGEFKDIGKVTVEFDKTFTLKRGHEKKFNVTYKVNSPSDHATGSVKLTYVLSWE